MKLFLDGNICLDLLDSQRPTSKATIEWYLKYKDCEDFAFYFSSDFITTLFYILTQKQKVAPKLVIQAIDSLSSETMPVYPKHEDFLHAKEDFQTGLMDDFEDLFVLNSANRVACESFVTHDKEILNLSSFKGMMLSSPISFDIN